MFVKEPSESAFFAKSQSVFFVAGITGNVGGATARHLLAAGHKVRTVCRNPEKAVEWSSQGVDVRQGDFNDSAVLAEAMTGIEAAYLMLPPTLVYSSEFPKKMIASFSEALRLASPPRLVVLSSIGSEQTSGLGPITSTHLLEQAFSNLSIPTAFIRAGSFIENYTHGMKWVALSGKLEFFMAPTERAIPMIATDDIGKEVTRLLVKGWHGKKIVELGSPISPNDLARDMSVVLGKQIDAVAVPREKWASKMESFGLAPGTTKAYEEAMDGFNSGWIHFGVPGTEHIAGTTSPAAVFEKARKVQNLSIDFVESSSPNIMQSLNLSNN